MKVEVRNDSVIIEGYVNAVERLSKPLPSRFGHFFERVKSGAFKRSLERNKDVHILLNHDWNRDLGSIEQGNLELTEDNIGLHARAEITDADVIKKARNGELVGWSFGFFDRDVDTSYEHNMPTRDIKDLDLAEVSILDSTKIPAYSGNLIMARSLDSDKLMNIADISDGKTTECEQRSKPEPSDDKKEVKSIDYSKYHDMIKEMKGE